MIKYLILNFEGVIVKDINNDRELFNIIKKIYSHNTNENLSIEEFIEKISKEKLILESVFQKAIAFLNSNPNLKDDIEKILNKLTKKYKLILISNFQLKFIEKFLVKKNLQKYFKNIYSTKEIPYSKKEMIFEKIKKDNKILENEFLYIVGDSSLHIEKRKILNFTRKLNDAKEKKYLHKKLIDFKNSLVSFDIDGTITQLSEYYFMKNKARKEALERETHKKIPYDSFGKEWKTIKDNELKEKIRLKGYEIYDQKLQINLEILNLIKKLSRKNKLIIFSISSKKRIKKFLKTYAIEKYFKNYYSAKDDFGLKLKKDFMFKKLKLDFPNYKNYVHVGDLHEVDYLESKKAGFTPILIDNSGIIDITTSELLGLS